MMTIGDILRDARRSRRVSISDASEATRIREIYLVALEAEDWSVIGGRAWARGFLNSYAQYLRLDPVELVARFDLEVRNIDPNSSLSGVNAESLARLRRKARTKRLLISAALLFGAGVLLALFLSRSSFQPMSGEALAPAPVDATPSSNEDLKKQDDVALQSPEPQTEAERSQAVLKSILSSATLQESTGPPMGPLQLTVEADHNITVFAKYPTNIKPVNLEPGEVAKFNDSQAVQLLFNDSVGVEVKVNGELLPQLADPGQRVQLTCIATQVACEALSPAP